MPVAQAATDFTIDLGVPVEAIRVLRGPTRPLTPPPQGEFTWRLISHLSLNYLSLVDSKEGISALREILQLYGHQTPEAHHQIEGLRSVTSRALPIGVATR